MNKKYYLFFLATLFFINTHTRVDYSLGFQLSFEGSSLSDITSLKNWQINPSINLKVKKDNDEEFLPATMLVNVGLGYTLGTLKALSSVLFNKNISLSKEQITTLKKQRKKSLKSIIAILEQKLKQVKTDE